MNPDDAPLERLAGLVSPMYDAKDTMHDITHIERVRRRARAMCEARQLDQSIVEAAALVHGVVWSEEEESRSALRDAGFGATDVDHIITVAWESQKEEPATSVEGRVLHDAHLLEGDANFVITKTLVTGSARGQSLSETVDYFFSHVGSYRCAFPEHQPELEERERVAVEFFERLREEL